MKKYLGLLGLIVLLLFPAHTNAHVLISDETNSVGAVLHLTPDDDPVAGEPSDFFFDIQSSAVSQKTHSFSLIISSDDGHETLVPIQVAGSGIAATHTFPSQGAYTIALRADPLAIGDTTLSFSHPQRVSRGIAASTQTSPVHTWAEIGVVISLCGLLVLGIVAYNKRRALAVYIRSQK